VSVVSAVIRDFVGLIAIVVMGWLVYGSYLLQDDRHKERRRQKEAMRGDWKREEEVK
jgi:hypothetical protein